MTSTNPCLAGKLIRRAAEPPFFIAVKVYDLFIEYEAKETFEGNIQCNKENFGTRCWAQSLTPFTDAIREHKFSDSLDE